MARQEYKCVVLLKQSLSMVFTNQITTEGPPTHLFDGKNNTYETKKLKKLPSELEKSNQGVTEEQVSKQRKETPLPVQHSAHTTKTRTSKGRLHIPSIFTERFASLHATRDNKCLRTRSPDLTGIALLSEKWSFGFIFPHPPCQAGCQLQNKNASRYQNGNPGKMAHARL